MSHAPIWASRIRAAIYAELTGTHFEQAAGACDGCCLGGLPVLATHRSLATSTVADLLGRPPGVTASGRDVTQASFGNPIWRAGRARVKFSTARQAGPNGVWGNWQPD
ncbi:hypothetical protein Ate01nite_05570 [Actinoplanes teichomyceticus]|nr:hypothetical protein Ate01nite_05570 [Actinoplanes teichomyceticus]